MLRRDDEELALAPQPSLRHVGSLVKRLEAAGLPVELGIEGDARELPIGLDLTAYRVVQEALGGALEHGHAGRARVRLRYSADQVELEIADDGDEPDAAAARDPRARARSPAVGCRPERGATAATWSVPSCRSEAPA